nr:MAG TPA: hypothetical protein [Caudoviricetes sp.]
MYLYKNRQIDIQKTGKTRDSPIYARAKSNIEKHAKRKG